jgi:threonine synthase
MTGGAWRLACAACGWTPGPLEIDPYPFRCPNAGTDDGDHVISVVGQGFSPADPHVEQDVRPASGIAENPFIRFRTSFYSWHLFQARADKAGLAPWSAAADREYISLVERVDAAIARVAGHGFRVTPFCRADRLSAALGFEGRAPVDPAGARHRVPLRTTEGGVWVKDETGNVSGSHKARHLMGVALYVEVLRRLGIDRDSDRPLAVASCGNAALAAAVVARAIARRLLVFVPDHASQAIVARLEDLGAVVTRCAREDRMSGVRRPASDVGSSVFDFGLRASDTGQREGAPGDPSYLAFRRAVADGALPFSCQGNENGLAIEGAMTLAYEMVDQASAVGRGSSLATLDRVLIQVGGGALASACVQALAHWVHDGRLAAMPRVHAVQTRSGYALKRAYDLVVDHIFACLAESSPGIREGFATADDRARYLLRAASPEFLDDTFVYARTHRSQFMWPWESEPRSIAAGILDDETYDWAVVVEGMVQSGGFPIVVDEATLEEANALARETTGIDVDHTGSSGLAGLVALTRSLDRPRPTERIAVLFTGVRR